MIAAPQVGSGQRTAHRASRVERVLFRLTDLQSAHDAALENVLSSTFDAKPVLPERSRAWMVWSVFVVRYEA